MSKSSLEKNKTLTKLVTDAWGKRSLGSYIRGIRMGGKNTKEINEELLFLEQIAKGYYQ